MINRTGINPVAVTAYTALSAVGMGNNFLYQALLNKQSALSSLSLFDVPFTTPVAEIKIPLPEIDEHLKEYACRNAQVALAALNFQPDAVRPVIEKARSTYGSERIGVIIGTSTSGLYETESAYRVLLQKGDMPDDFHFLNCHAYQATPRFLQKELQLHGPCYAISTACSSAAKAIAAGQRLIANDICDAVLVGGVDTLCRLTLRGFHSLGLVAEQRCTPMDKDRKGINIGEGAGLLVLEKSNQYNQSCPHLLAVGESSDAFHMSSPHPDGLGAIAAMQNALQLSSTKADEIDYLNLHATATLANDTAEAKAVYQVFSDSVPCSGSKGIIGHALGAAGAIEAVIALLSIKHQFLPGTVGLQQTDSECQCQVLKATLTGQKVKLAMSNSFGFGGNNASVIFSDQYE